MFGNSHASCDTAPKRLASSRLEPPTRNAFRGVNGGGDECSLALWFRRLAIA